MWGADHYDFHEESDPLYKSIPFFLSLRERKAYGLLFDNTCRSYFDFGATDEKVLSFGSFGGLMNYYFIYGRTPLDIISAYTRLTGTPELPPLWALGYHQSKWSYYPDKAVYNLVERFRGLGIPCDAVHLDHHYMERKEGFTWDKQNFPDAEGMVRALEKDGVKTVLIVNPGVKVNPANLVWKEGMERNYFCRRSEGNLLSEEVWPGLCNFPDFTAPAVRGWWADLFSRDIGKIGVRGLWNDMNEPAMFCTPEGVAELKEYIKDNFMDNEETSGFVLGAKVKGLANNPEDYKRFYHNVDGKKIRHDKVHNLFGYNMTRAAGEAFERIDPEKRFLMFSRSSYIGMHRYGGIWTGDNKSWWSHILLNLKMLPSLNMCGFLYTGADLGGFGSDTTRELLLRFLALGVFTPLMRNHSATGTREQECYQFEKIEDFRAVINTRYRLVPYLYSEYMKAVLNDDMYFKPLGFVYPDDKRAIRIEDQLMLGNEIMIAPVYEQNARGRYVYLPEEMKFIKFMPDGSISEEVLAKGIHYVDVALNEVPLFIRSGKCIPVAEVAECVKDIDTEHLQLIGYKNSSYTMYEDDGIHKDYDKEENYRVFTN